MIRIILLALSALIVYGSLFPFDLSEPVAPQAALRLLVEDWRLFTSRGDVLGNIGLFLPFGLFAFLASKQSPRPWLALAGYFLFALVVAIACQLGQIYIPSRHAAMGDVVWNMVGTVFGIAAARLLGRFTQRLPQEEYQVLFPMALIALWMIAELAPMVPTLSLSSLRENLGKLLIPAISGSGALLSASGIFLAAALLESMLGVAYARWATLLLMILVSIGKVIVVNSGLEIATLAGLLGGFWAYRLVSARARSEVLLVAMLLLFVTITVRGLEPLTLRDVPEAWQWLPFATWLKGSMVANLKSLAISVFLYGAMLGLVAINRRHVLTSCIALALWVTVLEVVQLWIEGRSGDPSEPLLVLIVGFMIRALRPSGGHGLKGGFYLPAASPVGYEPGQLSVRRAVIELVVACALIAIAIGIVLRFPRMPYNVRELFLDGGSFFSRAAFALALLWIGGGAVLAGRFVQNSRVPLLAWLWTMIAVSIVSLTLLSISVTQESIADIAGSTNLYWFATNRDIWGTWWRELFLWLNSPRLVSFFERPVRFAALYGPVIVFLAIFWLGRGVIERQTISWARYALIVASTLPWLWLCKAIAFDWSSTDNLNELIARDGNWGWGGGGYLYALLGLITANAVLLTSRPATRQHVAQASLTTLLAIPVGWWLINVGLEAQVHKYGKVFSGVQFLLGPDRAQLLSPVVLFGRWAAVQLAATLIFAAGLRVASPWAGFTQPVPRNGQAYAPRRPKKRFLASLSTGPRSSEHSR